MSMSRFCRNHLECETAREVALALLGVPRDTQRVQDQSVLNRQMIGIQYRLEGVTNPCILCAAPLFVAQDTAAVGTR